jgi:antitoxin (DNA-binding transcriptional repressor) of toxin-antitoxin stability system
MVGRQAVTAIQIDELEENARAVLRRVNERGDIVDVADGDAVVARLMPVETAVDVAAIAEWWKHHDELVEEIDRHWPDDVSVAEAIADIRREL